MNIEPFREMQPREWELIRRLLSPAFPGRDELSQQLETAKVRVIDEEGSLEFLICSDVKADHAKYVVPTEGEYEDCDAITVHVLLHLAGDKAKELEFFKENGSCVQSWPEAESVRVFAPA